MAKPRKEQVRNLKTEYKVHNFAELSNSYGNAQSQQFDDSIGQYSYFINDYTYTKKLGGSIENCPAFIRGVQGPWVVPSGSSFTVQISNFNNEQPIVVTIQPSDLVKSGNVSVLTAGRLAERINTALGMGSISTDSQKCAYVDNGQFCMRSRNTAGIITGSDAYITLANITSNFLGILGITNDTTITSFGVTGPTRGVVTESADGLGGYVQLCGGLDKSIPVPSGTNLHRTILNDAGTVPTGWKYSYEPDDDPRSPIHGRIRRSRTNFGESFQLQYFQNTKGFPKLDFKLLDPSTINSTDSITITLGRKFLTVLTVNIPFTTSPNRTFSDLVNEINNAWGVSSVNAENPRSACVVLPVEGRFTFTQNANLRVTFDGNLSYVNVSFSAGSTYTHTSLAAHINSAISGAGQSALGSAMSGGLSGPYTVEIRSLSGDGENSSVKIESDSDHISEVLGLVPGLYRGWNIAKLIGGDTIRLQSPIRGGEIHVQFNGPDTMAKFHATSGTISGYVDLTELVPARAVASNLSIPEMMEFWEVPDGISSQDVEFETQTLDRKLIGGSGWAASAVSSLIGYNGRIPTGILPISYDILRASLIQIQTAPSSSYTIPKIQGFTGNSIGPNNILELNPADSVSATQMPIRMFATGNSIIYTTNANRNSESDALWYKDASSLNSYFLEFKDGALSMGSYAPSGFTWMNSAWSRVFAVDDPVQLGAGITLGGRGNTLPPDSPRLSVARRNTSTGGTPSGNNRFTLFMESAANGLGASVPLRVYLTTSQNSLSEEANGMMFTVNARWDQASGLWVRDVTSQRSTAWITGSQSTNGSLNQTSGIYMYSMDANTWTNWTKVGEFSNTWNNSLSSNRGLLRFGDGSLHILSASNVVKAWGRFLYTGGLSINGYNVTNITSIGGGEYTFDYINQIGGSMFLHTVSVLNGYATPAVVANGSSTINSARIAFWNAATNAAHTTAIGSNSIIMSI